MTEELYEKKPGNGCVAELYFNGKMTRRQLEFLADSVKKYRINKTTLNQRGNLIVWNLRREALADFLAEAGKAGILCGSAYVREKRHVLCAPLSGMEEGECFDVLPYAEAARGWLREHVSEDGDSVEGQGPECPFTVYFSNVPRLPAEGKNCDMVFGAIEGGLFGIWAKDPAEDRQSRQTGPEEMKAEGQEASLFRLADRVEAGRFLSYINVGLAVRGRAADADEYRSLFWQTLAGLPDEERRPVKVETTEITKTGTGNFTCGPRVVKQKQEDLYAVRYHPLGGVVNVAFWQKLLRSVEKIEDVEFRLDSRMDFYVCNLLAEEVGLPMDSMADGAFTAAEASPVQTLCGLCVRANCDAQMFEHVLLKETKKLGFADGVLPAFTVAGCKDACGDISEVDLRFLAKIRWPEECGEAETTQTDMRESAEKEAAMTAGKAEKSAGNSRLSSKLWFTVESQEGSGSWHPVGEIPQQKLTEYLIALGALPQSAGMSFKTWQLANPGLLEKVTALYAAGQ
ncbi:MAG: hypothetical protein HFI88_05335 [Lachnospiraceae bacterium]|nr:hypothetical protein [Lachnospiraceae bacterium]